MKKIAILALIVFALVGMTVQATAGTGCNGSDDGDKTCEEKAHAMDCDCCECKAKVEAKDCEDCSDCDCEDKCKEKAVEEK